jgi:beta-glucanase (GH16 family)
MKLFSFCLITVLFATTACSKKDSATPTPTAITPTNLTLAAVVSTDKSGNVDFNAAANNAASFIFDFGNGATQTSATGGVTYKYNASGTYTVTVTARSSSGQTATKSVVVTVDVTLSVTWSDEFNVDGLPDATKWGYDLGNGNGFGNNELEYYTNRAENASVSNGTLKIIAKKENYSGFAYTSARLLSKGKYSFKYGKIEARAKLPAGAGTWPAIWMLGDNISTVSWPACGEIDIMEEVGNQPNKIFGTLHHPNHSGANGDGATTMIPTATTEFHVYSLEWSPTIIKFAVDGTTFYTFNNNGSLPFNQNFFIILNVAMGGNFGGTVDPAFNSATMEIDYVRVYQ